MRNEKQKKEHIAQSLFSLNRLQAELRLYLDMNLPFREDHNESSYVEWSNSLSWVNEQLFYAFASRSQHPGNLIRNLLDEKTERVESLEFRNKMLHEEMHELRETLKSFKKRANKDSPSLVEMSDLKLSDYIIRQLDRADVKTVDALIAKTEMDILKMQNLGKGSLADIKASLSALGLSLGTRNA